VKRFLILSFFTLLITANTGAQRRVPPGLVEADRQARQADKELAPDFQQAQQQTSFLELQRNAKELADLARSIPPDIDQTTKGLLPKDLAGKLKRIEKLAKQLRSNISH
jgi:predicted Rossmann fold nucleotide-binding protein DprA/Smf involved in DNA uptake